MVINYILEQKNSYWLCFGTKMR